MKKDKKEHNSENECEQASENNENLTEEIEAAAEKIDREAEALKAENAKLKDDYLRAYAELENTKKRCAAEMEKNSKYAVSSFAKEILSVADNLHRALAAAEELSGSECEQLKKGVELTESELSKVLAKLPEWNRWAKFSIPLSIRWCRKWKTSQNPPAPSWPNCRPVI